jgi:hypothetical protein
MVISLYVISMFQVASACELPLFGHRSSPVSLPGLHHRILTTELSPDSCDCEASINVQSTIPTETCGQVQLKLPPIQSNSHLLEELTQNEA